MSGREVYTVFDSSTRLPVSRVTCVPARLSNHVAEGQIAVPGRYDMPTARLSESGQPEEDAGRRTALELERIDSAARAAIEELERKQLRPLRELLIDPNNATARRKLDELNNAIGAQRAKLLLQPS